MINNISNVGFACYDPIQNKIITSKNRISYNEIIDDNGNIVKGDITLMYNSNIFGYKYYGNDKCWVDGLLSIQSFNNKNSNVVLDLTPMNNFDVNKVKFKGLDLNKNKIISTNLKIEECIDSKFGYKTFLDGIEVFFPSVVMNIQEYYDDGEEIFFGDIIFDKNTSKKYVVGNVYENHLDVAIVEYDYSSNSGYYYYRRSISYSDFKKMKLIKVGEFSDEWKI